MFLNNYNQALLVVLGTQCPLSKIEVTGLTNKMCIKSFPLDTFIFMCYSSL